VVSTSSKVRCRPLFDAVYQRRRHAVCRRYAAKKVSRCNNRHATVCHNRICVRVQGACAVW